MTEELRDEVAEEINEGFEKDFEDGFNDGEVLEESEDTDDDMTEETEDSEEDKTEEDPPDKEEEETKEPPEQEEDKKELPEEDKEEDKEEEKEPDKEEEEKPPEPLKVFFLGKEIDVQPDDIPDLVQKGLNHARMETRFKQMEEDYKYVDQFLDMAAYFDVKPEELIKHSIEGYKNFEVSKFTEKNIPEEEAKELFNQRLSHAKIARANQPKPKNKERDTAAEIDELFKIRPDLRGMKEFPKEVALDIQKGVDVKTAYLKHESTKQKVELKDLNAKITELESKLKAVEQEKKLKNAPKSQKGAGSGSTKTDPFVQGFLNDDF